jgi:hypothetical protein
MCEPIDQRAGDSQHCVRMSKRKNLERLVKAIASPAAGEAVHRTDGRNIMSPRNSATDNV